MLSKMIIPPGSSKVRYDTSAPPRPGTLEMVTHAAETVTRASTVIVLARTSLRLSLLESAVPVHSALA